MGRRYGRSGGLGDVLFLRAGLELVAPCSLKTAGTIAEAQWAMPEGVTLTDAGPVEEDLNPLYEHHPLRLAVDRVSLGELKLHGKITTRKLTGFKMPDKAREWATKALGPLDGPFVAVVDSSFGEHRHLPVEWVEQVCALLREAGFYPLVLGARTRMPKGSADLRFVKRTTLTEAAAILEQCAALLCVDTGLSALAGWLGVPQACIFQSQPPWCRLARLPGLFTGYFCAAREGMPASYGGDLPQGEMPPAEVVADAVQGLAAGKRRGKYWRAGIGYFDNVVTTSGKGKAYYQARIDGEAGEWDVHRAVAALEEQQVAVATSGAVTVARTEDLPRAGWLLDGPVRPAEEPLRSILCTDRLNALRQAALAVRDIEGDVAEVGLYEGGVTRMLALMLPAHAVYGFDTFAGLPKLPRHTLDFHREGEFEANLAEVAAYLADLRNVTLKPGIFPATAAGLEGHTFALVHLDCDLYEPTRAGLEFFWPRLAEGGAIYLDDYQWRDTKGVTAAVDEFLSEHPDATLVKTMAIQARIYRVKTKQVVLQGVQYITGDSCLHRELGECKRGEFKQVQDGALLERLGKSRHFEVVEKIIEVPEEGEGKWTGQSLNGTSLSRSGS